MTFGKCWYKSNCRLLSLDGGRGIQSPLTDEMRRVSSLRQPDEPGLRFGGFLHYQLWAPSNGTLALGRRLRSPVRGQRATRATNQKPHGRPWPPLSTLPMLWVASFGSHETRTDSSWIENAGTPPCYLSSLACHPVQRPSESLIMKYYPARVGWSFAIYTARGRPTPFGRFY